MEVLFDYCCQIMYALGNLLGLSYQEVCVIGNIYVQGALLVAAAAVPVWLPLGRSRITRLELRHVSMCCAAQRLSFIFASGMHHHWLPLSTDVWRT